MIINAAAITGLYRSFSTLFNQAMEITQVYWPQIASRVPSGGKQNTYAWLGAFPFLKEWLGDRQLENLKLHDYTITNKSYESTVEVDRDDIKDDQIGVYRPIIEELGRGAKVHPDYLIATLMAAGFTSLCYDGQYFFDTDHPVGSGTASNFGGGSGTAWYLLDTTRFIKPFFFQDREAPEFVAMDKITDEQVFMRKKFRYGVDYRGNVGYGLWQLAYASKDTLNPTNYSTARAAMRAYTNDKGIPLGIMPNLLVAPASLEGAARTLLKIQNDAAGAGNPWYQTADVLIHPWLS